MRERVEPETGGKASWHDLEIESRNAKTHDNSDNDDVTEGTPDASFAIEAAIRYLAEINRAGRRKSDR